MKPSVEEVLRKIREISERLDDHNARIMISMLAEELGTEEENLRPSLLYLAKNRFISIADKEATVIKLTYMGVIGTLE